LHYPKSAERSSGAIKPVGAIYSSPVIYQSLVYFGSYDGKLYALKTDTGDGFWAFDTGAQIYASPLLTNGAVYFGTETGRFFIASSALSGEKNWAVDFGAPIAATAVYDEGAYPVGC
jgi:outer membrane protein assembly factor BamB